MSEVTEELTETLIDVSGLSLSQLDSIDGTTLARVLRHVLDGEQAAPVAGFQSSI